MSTLPHPPICTIAVSGTPASSASRVQVLRLAVTPKLNRDQSREQDQRRQRNNAQHADRHGYSPTVELWTEGGPGGPDDPRVDDQEPGGARERAYRGQVLEK